MRCCIDGPCVTLRMGINESTTDALAQSVMANADDLLDFQWRFAVRPVGNNKMIIFLERHLLRNLQEQATNGLVGDDAVSGPFPRGREGAKIADDV